jgi:tetratricopeptide (TPR) repeat protein
MDPRTLKLRAVAEHCRTRQCEDAISDLEDLLRSEPANAELHHQLGICYSGVCQPHSQVSSGMAISYLRQALSLAGPAPSPLRSRYLDSLGNLYLHDRQPAAAMPFLQEAAAIYRKLGRLGEWAREEYNLGNACCDMPLSQMPQKWQQAVVHYRHALAIRTREHDPIHHAATLQNLGTAYRELACGDRAVNVRMAIACYLGALRIYKRADFPAKYGGLHNNLGNAYLSLPGPPPAVRRNLRRALVHFNRALQIRSRASKPYDYAATQFNRGQAYLKRAQFDPADLKKAVSCFREARECFLLCQDATMAALAKSGLERIGARVARQGQTGCQPAPGVQATSDTNEMH